MEGRKFYGYMRCSSKDQNEDRQLIALKEMGVPEKQIYMDKQSGKDFDRPPVPLPDNFYDIHKQWRDKKLTLKQAAKACNLAASTFFDKAKEFEKG